MGRQVGSKNKPKQDPGTPVILDDYVSAWTGAGTGADRSTATRARHATLLTQQDCQNLYIADGMARKVVDIPAEEMTRTGVELVDLDDEALEEAVEVRLDELDAMRHINDAIRWSRLYGGSIIIFGLNDGGTLDAKLNPDGIRSVEFIRVLDRHQATVKTRVLDANLREHGQPDIWMISPKNGGMPYEVHNSRIHIIDGEALPDQLRQQNEGWGASVYQACINQLTRLGMGHQWANMLLERSQQAVHKIPNLGTTLASPGGEALVQRRVNVVDMVRGVLNTVVVDSAEDYAVTTSSLAGVPDVLDRFAEALSAVTSIPIPILMGRATGGLSSTDKGTLDAWYARVESMWNDQARKPIDRLITYIMIAMGQDKPYKLRMKPLTVLSAEEEAGVEKSKAETRKLIMEADTGYINVGVVDPDEVRKGLEQQYDLMPGSAAPDVPTTDPVVP